MDGQTKIPNLISFDIFRTLGMPNTQIIKPEDIFRKAADLKHADWVLFPPHHLVNLMAFAFQRSVFPSINTYHLGFDKIQMTRAFMVRFPENTPHTMILPKQDHAMERIPDQMTFPFVVKEVRNSQGKGVFLVKNRSEFMAYAKENEILYAQEYLDIHRDLRVVWVGNKVVLAYWRVAAPGGFLNNVAAGGTIDYDNIPEEAIRLVTQVCRTLNIDYAGFDVAESDGHYYLLEYNLFFGTQALNDKKIPLPSIIYQYLLEQTNNITPRNPVLPLAV